ncbi:MAG: DNA gyrase subunit A, partial [Acidobacteriota bacterium]|nr:DNA gyrase subunit A [Acidobacteriota bacterium]
NQFGDPRRSEVVLDVSEINIEDLITPEDMVVTLSHTGYFKRQPLADYRAQRRGGRGKQATSMKDEDFIDHLFIANTHDTVLCFSNRGRCYWLRVYEVPEGTRNARGKPIVNLFQLLEGEKITAVLPIKAFDEEHFVFMATGLGTVKKTALSAFANPRKAGIIAVDLDEGDHLIGVAITNGESDVMLFSDAGKAVRFIETDVRPMGRGARGVRGMSLEDGQKVIAMLVAQDEAYSVLTATENGYGKRTPIAEYTRHGRGTKGMIAIQTSDRNGALVGAVLVEPQDEVMLISTGGVLIRTSVESIREMGRSTQGVTLINLDEGTVLAGIEKVAESDVDVVAGAQAAEANAGAEAGDDANEGSADGGDSDTDTDTPEADDADGADE